MPADLSLPTTRSVSSKRLSDYSILLYGEEKIGKTTLAAQFPKAMFLMCEPGSKALTVYQRPVKNWDDFKGYLRLLAKDKTFENIIVDTVDIAYMLCEKACSKSLGVEDINDAEFGKGWRKVTSEFKQWMSYAGSLGKGVVYLAHATEKSIKNRDGDERHRVVPVMDKRAASVMEAMVDIWAYYHYDRNGTRSIQIRGTEEVSAGVRTPNNFLGVSSIPGGRSAEEAYTNFVAAFENRLQVSKPKVGMGMKLKIGGK